MSGGSGATVVKGRLTLEGSLEGFTAEDREALTAKLAAMLDGVGPSDILLLLSAGSVVVDFEVPMATPAAASAAVDRLSAQSIAELSRALDVVVLAANGFGLSRRRPSPRTISSSVALVALSPPRHPTPPRGQCGHGRQPRERHQRHAAAAAAAAAVRRRPPTRPGRTRRPCRSSRTRSRRAARSASSWSIGRVARRWRCARSGRGRRQRGWPSHMAASSSASTASRWRVSTGSRWWTSSRRPGGPSKSTCSHPSVLAAAPPPLSQPAEDTRRGSSVQGRLGERPREGIATAAAVAQGRRHGQGGRDSRA